MLMSFFQEIFSEFCDKSDHIVVLFSFLIHIDELTRLWSALEIRSEVEQGVTNLDYLDVDEDLTTNFFMFLSMIFFIEEFLVHDEETVEVMNLEAKELNFK